MSSEADDYTEDSLRLSLIKKCIEAKEFAYCPYSKFRVGAAVLVENNQIFVGCNVENASYGLSICAERTAIVKAVSEGYTKIKEIAVSTDVPNEYVSPCGSCRQFISEFGLDITVIMVKSVHEYKIHTIGQLLPFAFDINILKVHAKEILNKNDNDDLTAEQQKQLQHQHHYHHH